MHICERPNVAGLVDNQATAIYPQGSELKKMSHIQFVWKHVYIKFPNVYFLFVFTA